MKKMSFMDKMFHNNDRLQLKLDELKKQSRKATRQIHQDILELSTKFPDSIVDLAFDSLLMMDESERYYAFAAGDNGITRLPMVISMAENPSAFDLEEFRQQLYQQMEESQLDTLEELKAA